MRMISKPLVALLTFGLGVLVSALAITAANALTSVSESSVNPVQLQTGLEEEKYAVLSAVINAMYIESDTSLLVIANDGPCTAEQQAPVQQRAEELENFAFAGLPGLKSETIMNFHEGTRGCHRLQREFDIPVTYLLVDRSESNRLFDSGWSQFHKKYPGSSGVLNFSEVAFDFEQRQALVGVSHNCGGECGAGGFVLLRKVDGIWRLDKQIRTWVS
jgi:hypothetical protein